MVVVRSIIVLCIYDEKISLTEFKTYGRDVQNKLGFETIPTTFGMPLHPKHEPIMLRNEKRFFHLMTFGDNGADITLKYGVDVECEGAYDPQTKTYDRVYEAYSMTDGRSDSTKNNSDGRFKPPLRGEGSVGESYKDKTHGSVKLKPHDTSPEMSQVLILRKLRATFVYSSSFTNMNLCQVFYSGPFPQSGYTGIYNERI